MIAKSLHANIPGRLSLGMPGDPHGGSKVWKAADREIGKPGENRGKVIAHRDLEPAAAFHDREKSLQPSVLPVECRCVSSSSGPVPRAAWNSSARLVLSSNSGYSMPRNSRRSCMRSVMKCCTGENVAPSPPKSVRETEAEAVAFVVRQAIGLENGTSAADYIPVWNGDANLLREVWGLRILTQGLAEFFF
jgi:hypothetical protein